MKLGIIVAVLGLVFMAARPTQDAEAGKPSETSIILDAVVEDPASDSSDGALGLAALFGANEISILEPIAIASDGGGFEVIAHRITNEQRGWDVLVGALPTERAHVLTEMQALAVLNDPDMFTSGHRSSGSAGTRTVQCLASEALRKRVHELELDVLALKGSIADLISHLESKAGADQ